MSHPGSGGASRPDTGTWDPDRNTNEFVEAMEDWRDHGLLAFTLNLQGGSPTGYGNRGWINSAFEPDGSMRPDYLARLERILNRTDELGMVVILGYFYFGQDEVLEDEAAVLRAIDNATGWIKEREYRNHLVEANNECNIQYDHEILQPHRVHELIRRIQENETAAVSAYPSWGLFDFRKEGESFDEGFQIVPVNWRISSERKRGFFELIQQITAEDR